MMRQRIRAGQGAMQATERVPLITTFDQLADVAGREATLDRLRAHFPGATVALHAGMGTYDRWWTLLQGEMATLACLAVWPRPDNSLGKGCVDALVLATESNVSVVLASPRGVVEHFNLVRGDDDDYRHAGVVLADVNREGAEQCLWRDGTTG